MSDELERLAAHPQIMDALFTLATTLHVLKGIHGRERVERAYRETIDELPENERRVFLELTDAIGNEQRRRQIN